MRHGGAPPVWRAVWVFARDMGIQPWDVDGQSKLIWYLRWGYWKEIEAKIAKAKHG